MRPFSLSLALIELGLIEGLAIMSGGLYTKCLTVAPIPPLCTPLMYAEQMVPER